MAQLNRHEAGEPNDGGNVVLRAFMADLGCRRFVLTVLADTADLFQYRTWQIKFTVNSLVWEFDLHDKTEDKLSEVARLNK